jgi:hypothetical protein
MKKMESARRFSVRADSACLRACGFEHLESHLRGTAAALPIAMTKTKSTRKPTTRPLTLADLGHVAGGMNKADLTEQKSPTRLGLDAGTTLEAGQVVPYGIDM